MPSRLKLEAPGAEFPGTIIHFPGGRHNHAITGSELRIMVAEGPSAPKHD